MTSEKQGITRTHLHTRNVHCEGYARSDGLWDIEARLVDTKTQPFHNHERGEIQPGEPIHEMILVMTLDLDLEIQDVEINMPWTPFGVCPKARKKMKELIGLKIAPGWMREVRARIPGNQSCTHLIELLGPVSTTAYQTMHIALEQRENAREQRNKPPILDQCHALTRDSAQVKVMWPQFYRKNPANKTKNGD